MTSHDPKVKITLADLLFWNCEGFSAGLGEQLSCLRRPHHTHLVVPLNRVVALCWVQPHHLCVWLTHLMTRNHW